MIQKPDTTSEGQEEPQQKKDDLDGPLGVYCYLVITVLIIGVVLSGFLALFGRGTWLRFLIILVVTLLLAPVLVRVAKWKWK